MKRFLFALVLFLVLFVLVLAGEAEAQGGSGAVLCQPSRCEGMYQYYLCSDGFYTWHTWQYSNACLYNSSRYLDNMKWSIGPNW